MQTINHYSPPSFDRRRIFTAPALLIAMLFLVPCGLQAAVDRLGNPFTPAGATNFSLTALQGIDGNPLGGTGSPQVNLNFEFPLVFGVTIDQGGGKLKDFGIGLYADAAKATQSTGLEILYNTPIFAESATATVLDFDIEAGKDTAFKLNKVSPSIAFLGPGNTILDTALPADIFPFLVPTTGAAKGDTWNINFAGLAGKLGLTGQAINGFILFAHQGAGEEVSSDPYLLVSVGNGTQIPEPSTIALIIATAGLGAAYRGRRRFLH